MEADVRAHWDKVGILPCCLSWRRPVTLHHCHGGSMIDVLGSCHRSLNQKTSDWLVIPLAAEFHSTGGPYAIDGPMGVVEWERRFGTQVDYLDGLCKALGYNVWKRAGIEREVEGVSC